MGYYRITIRLKGGKPISGIRFSNKPYHYQRQQEFEEKANAAYGKDRVDEVNLQAVPDDHPNVKTYLQALKNAGRPLPGKE